jgi:hypothetical protein
MRGLKLSFILLAALLIEVAQAGATTTTEITFDAPLGVYRLIEGRGVISR